MDANGMWKCWELETALLDRVVKSLQGEKLKTGKSSVTLSLIPVRILTRQSLRNSKGLSLVSFPTLNVTFIRGSIIKWVSV